MKFPNEQNEFLLRMLNTGKQGKQDL